MSLSRPDPSSPTSIADASFGTSRRGFDQAEVRDFLRMVAAEFGRLRERERFLDRELQAAQAEGGPGAPVDEEAMIRLLGEESVRMLTTARESANEIRAKAEQAAAQLLHEAADEANRVREEADIEASRRRADAAADAEAELSMAKQQGREMVNEARAYRERVLSELARRRELAREQIEQLIHGRDRLMQAFERARLVAVDVVAEMQPLGEPDEYVNLTPTTGPLPVMIANSPRPDDSIAVTDAAPATDDTSANPARSPGDLRIVGAETETETDTAEIDDAGGSDADADADAEVEAIESDTDPHDIADAGVIADADADADADGEVDAEADAAADESDPSAEETADADAADVTDDEGADDTTVDAETLETGEGDDPNDVVVDLFARLRADTDRDPIADDDAADVASAAAVASEEPGSETDVEDEPEVEPSVFECRDEVITPLIVASAKKLKRALADEQNDVLDALRRSDAVHHIDTLLPWASEHAKRYTDAIAEDLLEAVYQGSATSHTSSRRIRKALATESVEVANEAVVQWLVAPLRDRLARCITEGEGDNAVVTKKVRAVYREWKTQRIDETLDDVLRCAHGRGVLAGFDLDTPIVWEVDERFPACPDCDDNALAGAIAAGAQFPTGDSFAPAHQGCRCLLVAADR